MPFHACFHPADVPQGVDLRPLVLDDFFEADGTSVLPPREDLATVEEALEKIEKLVTGS